MNEDYRGGANGSVSMPCVHGARQMTPHGFASGVGPAKIGE